MTCGKREMITTVMDTVVDNQDGNQMVQLSRPTPPPPDPSPKINKVKEMMDVQSKSMDERMEKITQPHEKSLANLTTKLNTVVNAVQGNVVQGTGNNNPGGETEQ